MAQSLVVSRTAAGAMIVALTLAMLFLTGVFGNVSAVIRHTLV